MLNNMRYYENCFANHSKCINFKRIAKVIKHILLILIPLGGHLYAKSSTVGVVNFKNLSDNSRNEWIAKSFSESIYYYLSEIKNIQIVERVQFEKTCEELKIQNSGLVDENTSLNIGKMLAAKYIILGSIIRVENYISVNSRIIEVDTGRIVKCGKAEGYLDGISDLQKKIARDIAEYFKDDNSSVKRKRISLKDLNKEINKIYLIKDPEEAVYAFNEILAQEPGCADAYIGLGNIYVRLGKYNTAIKKYKRALKLYKHAKNLPDTARTYCKIGEIHRRSSNYYSALKYYKLALKINDDIFYAAMIYSQISEMYADMGKYKLVAVYLKKIVEIFRHENMQYSYAYGMFKLASLYEEEGDYNKALESAGKANIAVENGDYRVAEANELSSRLKRIFNKLGISDNAISDTGISSINVYN